mmetsp:Transcript_90525/g.235761  ORF Transcript_90525/g.235761 Transcript_90525/m.235761 type:complete len:296 (+) Transcript_90525:960-1847(+)
MPEVLAAPPTPAPPPPSWSALFLSNHLPNALDMDMSMSSVAGAAAGVVAAAGGAAASAASSASSPLSPASLAARSLSRCSLRRSRRSRRAAASTSSSFSCRAPAMWTSSGDSLFSLSIKELRPGGFMLEAGSRAMLSIWPLVYVILVPFGMLARTLPLYSTSSSLSGPGAGWSAAPCTADRPSPTAGGRPAAPPSSAACPEYQAAASPFLPPLPFPQDFPLPLAFPLPPSSAILASPEPTGGSRGCLPPFLPPLPPQFLPPSPPSACAPAGLSGASPGPPAPFFTQDGCLPARCC